MGILKNLYRGALIFGLAYVVWYFILGKYGGLMYWGVILLLVLGIRFTFKDLRRGKEEVPRELYADSQELAEKLKNKYPEGKVDGRGVFRVFFANGHDNVYYNTHTLAFGVARTGYRVLAKDADPLAFFEKEATPFWNDEKVIIKTYDRRGESINRKVVERDSLENELYAAYHPFASMAWYRRVAAVILWNAPEKAHSAKIVSFDGRGEALDD